MLATLFIIRIVLSIANGFFWGRLAGQLVRSGASPVEVYFGAFIGLIVGVLLIIVLMNYLTDILIK
jgi:hypothetical protein